MRKSILAAAAVAGVLALPMLASAQDGAAAGAVTGGVTGAVVGGPVGAAVGAGVGAIAGGAADSASQRPAEQRVIVQQPSEPVSERTCTADSAGNRTCTEIRR